MEFTIARTRAFAIKQHGDQKDKNGRAYVEHLDTVAANVVRLFGFCPEIVKVAYLHDVVEDTAVTVDQISKLFGDEISISVDAISKRSGEANYDYIGYVLEDDWASMVKLADLYHNTCPERLAELPEQTQQRLRKKYYPAIYRLESALNVEPTITREQAIEAIESDMVKTWQKMSAAVLRTGDRVRLSEDGDVYLVHSAKRETVKGGKIMMRVETNKGKFALKPTFEVQVLPPTSSANYTKMMTAKYFGEYVAPSEAEKPKATPASLAAAGVKV